uniref:M-ORF n=1 Tax=Unio crassus TaxID=143297 RepID=A0A1Q1MMJ8_9BIVA|nr:M-ORF [Unio crassus]AQM37764.1 M-ORF [Unio crassus]
MHDIVKWVKHCFSVSPVVATIVFFLFFFVLGLMIFGLWRAIDLYWYSIYSTIMLVLMGSSWFDEKSVDSNKGEKMPTGNSPISSDEKKVGDVVSGVETLVVDKEDFKKGVDVNDLTEIIKKAVKEGIQEAMKDFVIKEAKKKKDTVVSGDATTPKKKSKKVLAKEMGETVSGTNNQEVAPAKKKKSKKSELVDKEVGSDK